MGGVARPAGLEPATSASAGQRSNPLSYGRVERDRGGLAGGSVGVMVPTEGFEPPRA